MRISFNRPSADRKQAGFNMVELMVALFLGLFVTTAVLQIFVGAKRVYEFQQELSRIQENGRFAIGFLTRDIRQADYWGCMSEGSSIVDHAGNDVGRGIEGFDAVAAGTSGYAPALGPLADGFLLRRALPTGIKVKVPSPFSAIVQMDSTRGFELGDALIISDCSYGASFVIDKNVNSSDKVVHHGTPGGLGIPGKDGYDIYRSASTRYWLRTGVSGEPALVRGAAADAWDTGGDELLEGVENVQILYGVDSSGNKTPNYFVPADQVADMGAVVSVQLHLLIRSLRDNMLDKPQAIVYYGESRVNLDRRLRKSFTSTVAIRNRLE
ncbi:MAG: type IV pilus assembly protein PilW [Motiliproteus sp.]|jgi:type IV pilus assembly protein PilW